MGNANEKDEPKVQADNNSIAVSGIQVGGNVGDIRIGHSVGYTVEEVSVLITQIKSEFHPKPFDGRCPYKGLAFFDEKDSELFFGREKLVEDLLSRVKTSRSLFITGPSGSGKSSLVRAGLIHALKEGRIENSTSWLYETMRPTREPFVELARIASSLAETLNAGEDIRTKGFSDATILAQWCEIALKDNRDRRAVIFIDQFEEVFTQVTNEAERAAFLNLLTHAATIENGRVIVLIAMRSDFVSNCATYPQLNLLLGKQFIQIGAMQPDELVSAMAQPALRVGLQIDPDLIAHIINDMKGEPGTLPLMQFALKELFEAGKARGGLIALTLSDYLERGGIQKMLAHHADNTFNELNAYEQELARSIFSGLIEIGRGTVDTRRTAFFNELVPMGAKTEEVKAIVVKLADARLLITGERDENAVTISHEKLIDAWPWLKKLVNDNRDVIALQNEIANDAKEWNDNNQDESYLYTGARLANARERLDANKIVLGGLAQSFIESGVKAHTDELEAVRQRAAQLRQRSIYLTVALIAALIAVGAAVSLWAESQKQANIARAGERAAISISNLVLDPELSLHLAVQSINTSRTLQGEDALRRAILPPPVELTLHGHAGSVYSVAYDHEGKRLVTASQDGTARIWDAKTGDEIRVLSGHTGAVKAAAFSPDGLLVATVGADRTVRIWDARTWQQLRIIDKHTDAVNGITFSPDGEYILTASDDFTARVWQAGSGEEIHLLDEHSAAVLSAVYSPNGEFIATGGNDSTIHVWDAATGNLIKSLPNYDSVVTIAFSPDSGYVLTNWVYNALRSSILEEFVSTQYLGGHTFYVTSVAFNPSDGGQIATGSRDHTVRLWDTASGNPIEFLRGHSGTVFAVAFDPSGDHLATASEDQTVRIWDIAEWRKRTLIGHPDFVDGAAYSFDGRRIATTGEDGTIRIWDAESGRELKAWQYPDLFASGVSFSPDNRQLITASDDGTWRIWDPETGQPVYEHLIITHIVHDARFSRDGTRIITANHDGFAYIWDTNTKQQLHRLEGHSDWVSSGMFSRDGQWVATASADGTARVWDAQTGQEVRMFSGHSGLVLKAAFSSDGKRIVTASVDGTARIWDIASGLVLHTLKGHTAEVTDAVFSPDDQYIATASRDDTVRLWNADTGDEIIQLFGHTHDLRTVVFSPDGRYLLTSSLDGTARIYPVRFEDVMALAQSLLSPRQLTCAERMKYLHEEIACPTPTPVLTSSP